MTSTTTWSFRELLSRLPTDIQRQARKQFRLWRCDPNHPSVQFKQIRPGLWSARINLQYRALARERHDQMAWFWIGPHAEYDQILRND